MRRTSAHALVRQIRSTLGSRGYEAAVFRFYEERNDPAPFHVRVGRRWPLSAEDQTFCELAAGRAWLAQQEATHAPE